VKSQGPTILLHLWQAKESGKPFRWPPKREVKNKKGF
jgi:hypothetical protein